MSQWLLYLSSSMAKVSAKLRASLLMEPMVKTYLPRAMESRSGNTHLTAKELWRSWLSVYLKSSKRLGRFLSSKKRTTTPLLISTLLSKPSALPSQTQVGGSQIPMSRKSPPTNSSQNPTSPNEPSSSTPTKPSPHSTTAAQPTTTPTPSTSP